MNDALRCMHLSLETDIRTDGLTERWMRGQKIAGRWLVSCRLAMVG